MTTKHQIVDRSINSIFQKKKQNKRAKAFSIYPKNYHKQPPNFLKELYKLPYNYQYPVISTEKP